MRSKMWKRVFAVGLTMAMGLNLSLAAAAAGETNTQGVTFPTILDRPELVKSDADQTVTMTINVSQGVDLDSVAYTLTADSPLTVTAVTAEQLTGGSLMWNKDNGKVSWVSAGTADLTGVTQMGQITVTVPAGTAEGTYRVGFTGLTISKNFGGDVWESGAQNSAVLRVTAGSAAAAAEPDITTQPVGAGYDAGDTPAALTVAAVSTDGGAISYQWYKSAQEDLSDAAAITGAEGTSCLPDVSAAGTFYYFCRVTNTTDSGSAWLDSDIAAITVAEGTAEPTQDEEGYYVIRTAAQLDWFAAQVNSGTSVNARLGADITASAALQPIGRTQYYRGTFDGCGHILTLNMTADGGNYAGLFGYTYGATVKNVIVEGSVTNAFDSSSNATGALVGRASKTTLENCVNRAAVTGGYNVGGLVGLADGSFTMTDCENTGAVRATMASGSSRTGSGAGGLVGKVSNTRDSEKAEITASVNRGAVTGDQGGSIAGIVGTASGNMAVTACYNTGAITSALTENGYNIAGILGQSRLSDAVTLTACYSVGTVSAGENEDKVYVAGIDAADQSVYAGVCYLRGSAPRGVGGYRGADYLDLDEAAMKGGAALDLLNWGQRYYSPDTLNVNGGYPVLEREAGESATLTRIEAEGSPITDYVAGMPSVMDTLAVYGVYSDGTRARVTDAALAPATVTADTAALTVSGTYQGLDYSYSYPVTVWQEPALVDGSYQLGSLAELDWFAYQVNKGAEDDYAANLKLNAALTADIDASRSSCLPIGVSLSKPYAGVFDGAGHTVTLDIQGADWSPAMFAFLGGGTVKNLTVTGSVTGYMNVGGIVASVSAVSEPTLIENCRNDAVITAVNNGYAGGIVADVFTGGNVTIRGCVNTGAISGTGHVGGIAGALYGTVENCYNTGAVTAVAGGSLEDAGGIVGYIFPSTTVASGLKNCYNIGAVTAAEDKVAGELIGAARVNTAASTVENCYYLTGKNAAYTVISGSLTVQDLKGVSDADMKLAAAGLGSAYRDDPASAPINSGYPVLKWQVDETGGIDVPVINLTGAAPAAQVTAPAGGWQTGENTFTVSAPVACTVAVSHDGGATYTVLSAAANADGSYSFTADLTAASSITVVVKGDADNDGVLSMADAMAAMNAWGSGQGLSGTAGLAAKVSGGDLSMADAMAIMNAWGSGGFAW